MPVGFERQMQVFRKSGTGMVADLNYWVFTVCGFKWYKLWSTYHPSVVALTKNTQTSESCYNFLKLAAHPSNVTTKPLCHISTNPRVSVLHASLEHTCCLSFQIDEYLIGLIAWKLLLPLSCFCSFGLLHFFYLQTHKHTQAGISWHRGKHLHRNRGWDTIHGDICTLKQRCQRVSLASH